LSGTAQYRCVSDWKGCIRRIECNGQHSSAPALRLHRTRIKLHVPDALTHLPVHHEIGLPEIGEQEMLTVDSQVHIWGANTPERPWPARAHAQREIPLGHEQLLKDMNEAGIDRVVIVPPSWEGDRNDLAIEAVKQQPDRF